MCAQTVNKATQWLWLAMVAENGVGKAFGSRATNRATDLSSNIAQRSQCNPMYRWFYSCLGLTRMMDVLAVSDVSGVANAGGVSHVSHVSGVLID